MFSLSTTGVAVNTASLREEVLKVKGLREMQQERPISITGKQTLGADLLFYSKLLLFSQIQERR